jgi:hypothetical protein
VRKLLAVVLLMLKILSIHGLVRLFRPFACVLAWEYGKLLLQPPVRIPEIWLVSTPCRRQV